MAEVTGPSLYQTLMSEIEELPSYLSSMPDWRVENKKGSLILGKLGTKDEGAGKVRVFAITDI